MPCMPLVTSQHLTEMTLIDKMHIIISIIICWVQKQRPVCPSNIGGLDACHIFKYTENCDICAIWDHTWLQELRSKFLDGATVGCRHIDQMVRIQFPARLLSGNSRQVAHTHVPLLPSNKNRYLWKLEGKQAHYATHLPCVRGIAASAGVWLRAVNQRSAPHQRALALAMDDLYLIFYSKFRVKIWRFLQCISLRTTLIYIICHLATRNIFVN